MQQESQTTDATSPRPRAIVVTGAAGSGKTTLGRALASITGSAPLDLDSLTNPLLDAIAARLGGEHWLSGPDAAQVREGRYGALRSVAADVIGAGQDAVLIAPFTEELRGGAAWNLLRTALQPAEIVVLHLAGDSGVLAGRRLRRDVERDRHRSETRYEQPTIPHTRIDVLLSPEQQLFRALQAAGHRSSVDSAAAPFMRSFDGFLFDLDGTLADSTAAVLRSWARLADEYGFDDAAVHENHGRPAHALLRAVLKPEQVEDAAARVQEFETTDLHDVHPTPGALDLLAALPPNQVAIVTSGKVPVATARLRAAGIPAPKVVVTRDDVVNGKPDPEPFLLGAARLGVDPTQCLAFEDAAAGIAAAKAAGCTVVAVRGTSSDAALADADLVVDSLQDITATSEGGTTRIRPFR